MSDTDIIEQAYEDALKKIFSVFFEAYSIAQKPEDQAAAEQRFTTAVRLARATRDRANAILQL